MYRSDDYSISNHSGTVQSTMDYLYTPMPSKSYQNVSSKEGRDGEKKQTPSKQFLTIPNKGNQDGEKKYREIHR